MAFDVNKLFVLVNEPTLRDSALTASRKTGNRKIYFIPSTNEIITQGVAYGLSTSVQEEIATLKSIAKTYFADGTEDGIKAAIDAVQAKLEADIAALDLAEVGGTGKVITTISQTDGQVAATAIDLTAGNVAATAIVAGDDTVAIDGTTVEEQVASIGKEIKKVEKAAATYSVKKVTEGLATNVKEAYQLVQTVDGQSTDIDVQIPIYKDSSLKDVELTDTDADGKAGQFMKYTYITDEGAEKVVYLDCSKFLVESEFKAGLTVSDAGEVSVKIDEASDDYLTVSESGVKVAGVKAAIDTVAAAVEAEETRAEAAEAGLQAAIDTLNADATTAGSVAKAVADAKAELIDSADDEYNTLKKLENKIKEAKTVVEAGVDEAHIVVTATTSNDDSHTTYTITSTDVASKTDTDAKIANLLEIAGQLYNGQKNSVATADDIKSNLQDVIDALTSTDTYWETYTEEAS